MLTLSSACTCTLATRCPDAEALRRDICQLKARALDVLHHAYTAAYEQHLENARLRDVQGVGLMTTNH